MDLFEIYPFKGSSFIKQKLWPNSFTIVSNSWLCHDKKWFLRHAELHLLQSLIFSKANKHCDFRAPDLDFVYGWKHSPIKRGGWGGLCNPVIWD